MGDLGSAPFFFFRRGLFLSSIASRLGMDPNGSGYFSGSHEYLSSAGPERAEGHRLY